jgi:hypothetical protein
MDATTALQARRQQITSDILVIREKLRALRGQVAELEAMELRFIGAAQVLNELCGPPPEAPDQAPPCPEPSAPA